MKLRFPLLGLLALGLAGCGIGSASPAPTATPIPQKSYTDKIFGFSFRYPGDWKLPAKGGNVETISGVKTYVLPLDAPDSSAHLEVTVDGAVIKLPVFQEGHVAPSQDGSPTSMQYFHAHVAGLPAMRIHRISHKQVDEIDTIANTLHRSYDVRMVTGNPPFKAEALSAYRLITTTLQVPFS